MVPTYKKIYVLEKVFEIIKMEVVSDGGGGVVLLQFGESRLYGCSTGRLWR